MTRRVAEVEARYRSRADTSAAQWLLVTHFLRQVAAAVDGPVVANVARDFPQSFHCISQPSTYCLFIAARDIGQPAVHCVAANLPETISCPCHNPRWHALRQCYSVAVTWANLVINVATRIVGDVVIVLQVRGGGYVLYSKVKVDEIRC